MSWTFASFKKVKCTHYVDQDIFDWDCSLDIFEQTTNINELAKEIIKRELLIFRHYQLDVKDIKCPLWWWEKYKAMFLTIGFLICQIFGFVGS
jgi:hypothetical protein